MEEQKLTRVRILIIHAIKTLQDVMATSFEKNEGRVQLNSVIRVVEGFAEQRFMWRQFFLRLKKGEDMRQRIGHEIILMEPHLLEISEDVNYVKLTEHGLRWANESPEPVFSVNSVHSSLAFPIELN